VKVIPLLHDREMFHKLVQLINVFIKPPTNVLVILDALEIEQRSFFCW